MSLSQAERLLTIIKEDAPHTKAHMRRLAGNEWVIYLNTSQKYIWNIEDWHAHFPKKKTVEA